MNRRLLALPALLLALALGASLAGPARAERGDVPARSAAAPTATAAAPAKATTGTVVTRLKLVYRGRAKRPVTTRSANVPGIGDVDVYCRQNTTMIRLYTANRQFETQMWTQKYEQKGRESVAVKNARIYQFAHADDNGNGGTGFTTNEGFNQSTPPETFSQGYLNGIISQRSSRSPGFARGQLAAPRPVTTFELTWYWENLRQPARYRTCTVKASFTTVLTADQRMGITWHGTADAPGHDEQVTRVPGVGNLALSCHAGTDDDKTLTITPATPGGTLYVERVTGEGALEDHVDVSSQSAPDPETGAFTPVSLPSNGTLRLKVTNGSVSRWFLLSSYYVVTDRYGPQRNLCEVAVGGYSATFS